MKQIPICQGLTKPLTIAGIPREAFIFNIMLGIIFVLILETPILLILNIIIHLILAIISKKDSQAIMIFMKKYIKQKDYYYEG